MRTMAPCCAWSPRPTNSCFHGKFPVVYFLQKEYTMGASQQISADPATAATLTKAVVRAAVFLGRSQAALAEVLGVSGATASRLVSGRYALQPTRRREWEFALLFVRLF